MNHARSRRKRDDEGSSEASGLDHPGADAQHMGARESHVSCTQRPPGPDLLNVSLASELIDAGRVDRRRADSTS